MQRDAADPKRVLEALAGAGAVAIDGHCKAMDPELGHEAVLRFGNVGRHTAEQRSGLPIGLLRFKDTTNEGAQDRQATRTNSSAPHHGDLVRPLPARVWASLAGKQPPTNGSSWPSSARRPTGAHRPIADTGRCAVEAAYPARTQAGRTQRRLGRRAGRPPTRTLLSVIRSGEPAVPVTIASRPRCPPPASLAVGS